MGLEKHNQASNVSKEIKLEGNMGRNAKFYQILYTCKNIQSENINTYLSEISENPNLSNDDIIFKIIFPHIKNVERQ